MGSGYTPLAAMLVSEDVPPFTTSEAEADVVVAAQAPELL
jgi:hypothetical protein